jgi:hypothetical protein
MAGGFFVSWGIHIVRKEGKMNTNKKTAISVGALMLRATVT